MLTLAVFGRRSPNTALSTFDRRAGVSLFELMIVIAIVALLSMIALPQYQNYSDRAKVSRALGDIGKISTQIEMFRLRNNDRIPDSLLELGVDIPEDPWEQPYEYLKIAGRGPGVGGLRKDGKLNPLNSDFDLYSLGKDGDSKGPLSAKASHDDIIRANDGAYIGLGEDY